VAADTVPENVSALKAEVAVLNELLAVQERVVIEQSAKLEHTLQELREAKDAANASEDWLRSLVETVNDWIWEMNAEGVYTYASPRVRDLLGYEPEEMVGKRFFDFMPQEEATILAAVHEELVASRMPVGPREATLIHRDGHLVSIEVSGVPFFAPDGSLTGYRGVDRDITARKQVEKALRGPQERYRVISEGSPHGILIADSEGRQFAYANPCMCRLLGYTEKELLQLGVADIHPQDSLGHVASDFESQARGETTLTAELPCLRKDGTVFYADVTAAPITLDGGQVCNVGFFADVTERKQAQEKLQRYADDLERANEEVKQFAYIISHDLRGPLINLRGFTFELRSECATLDSLLTAALPHLDEEQQREATAALRQGIPQALEFIEASVARMDDFINAVLKLSRLGRNDLHFERVNLHDVVQSALDGLAHQIEERQVRVTVGRLPEVVGDRTAMEQIVGNILTNAVNYLEPGRPGEIEVAGERQGAETTFFVRDNGRGIAESDMPKVFALFRRAGKQDVKGEGMGLVYAQALAYRHGGYIRCDSELGVGTTFTVVLSNHPEEERAGNAPTAAG
jgi:PAS domain S-box-containing protein